MSTLLKLLAVTAPKLIELSVEIIKTLSAEGIEVDLTGTKTIIAQLDDEIAADRRTREELISEGHLEA